MEYISSGKPSKLGSLQIKELFEMSFELLKIAEESRKSYEKIALKNSANTNLAKKLIDMYYMGGQANYESMIYNFKKKYIESEARIEYNEEDKQLEYIGLGYMYDYIQQYVPSEKEFNIFIETMKLHELLYKAYDDKFNSDRNEEYAELQAKLAEAKATKNMKEYREISLQLKDFSESRLSFGGSLRNYEVDLKGVDYHVPTAREASIFLNSFLNPERKIEYQNILSSSTIFGYIEYCVKTCVDIIKYQPFNNGNKRTARALLNLMFKNKNLPPVYILKKERTAYKDALLKAITENDYESIINFYYFKICDSIYELDIKPGLVREKNIEKKIGTLD